MLTGLAWGLLCLAGLSAVEWIRDRPGHFPAFVNDHRGTWMLVCIALCIGLPAISLLLHKRLRQLCGMLLTVTLLAALLFGLFVLALSSLDSGLGSYG